MKYLKIVILFSTLANCVYGQTHGKFNFQTVLRDDNNEVLRNILVGVKLNIASETNLTNPVFTENHLIATNENGLISLQIGSGNNQIGSIDSLDWSTNSYLLIFEIDSNGGENYHFNSSHKFYTIPYSEYSRKTDSIEISIPIVGDTLKFKNGNWLIIPNLSSANGGFGTITNPITGRVWLDRNLGASRVAKDLNDELAYGDWYQWGRFSDGHQLRNSQTIDVMASTAIPNLGNDWDGKFITTGQIDWLIEKDDNLWQGVTGVNNPCPIGFRVPTIIEWMIERDSWSSDQSDWLKLTKGGVRWLDGSPFNVGAVGRYASSTASISQIYYFDFLFYTATGIYLNTKSKGLSVRCIKDQE